MSTKEAHTMGKQGKGKGKGRDADVLDFRQAQEFLNTTRTTLYRWINQGRIRAFLTFRTGVSFTIYRRLPFLSLFSVA